MVISKTIIIAAVFGTAATTTAAVSGWDSIVRSALDNAGAIITSIATMIVVLWKLRATHDLVNSMSAKLLTTTEEKGRLTGAAEGRDHKSKPRRRVKP